MPNLFDLLPAELFRPLASPGANVYAGILLQTLAETQRHHEPLSRERMLDLIVTALSEQPDSLALTADADAERADTPNPPPPNAATLTARSGAILRYLERCGWVKGETQSDFSQQFILPDYAFRVLGTLSDFVAAEPPPLAGLIYTIHGVLQEALRDGNADAAIPEAHRHTQQLVGGLKELYHNIGLHINRMLQRMAPREVLEHFFREYQSEVVDRAYHQLRTTDHVSRYRPGVLEALDRLGAPERIEQAARKQHERRESPSIEAAAARLYDQLAEMREAFERLDRQLQAIDTRHNQFVHAAVRAVEVHLAAHTTTSGQLVAVLKMLLGDRGDTVLPQVQQTMQFFRLELLDEGSLAPAARAGVPFEPDTETQDAPSAEELARARDQVLLQLSHAISPARVRRYAGELLDGHAELRAADIPLDTPEDLPLLMYLRAYGNGALGYQVEELDDWVQTDTVAFRNFRLVGPAVSRSDVTPAPNTDEAANLSPEQPLIPEGERLT
jgi:hypothetical protein